MIDLRDQQRLARAAADVCVASVVVHCMRMVPELTDRADAIALFRSLGWYTAPAYVALQGEDDWHRACCPACPAPPRGSYSLNWRHANRARLHMVDVHGWRFRVDLA